MFETTTDRTSGAELVTKRSFDAPARLVFRAWTTAELMQRWWVPASFGMTFVSCEMNAVTGGTYRFVFAHPAFPDPMAFQGRYIEVVPDTRIVWTNEESAEGAISTLTLTEAGGQTHLVLHERYPSKAALDEAIEQGGPAGLPEQFAGLDALLVTLA